ncbi:hypothetical protein [uncultured Enterovirga sp.]|uniref:hypothetical protein n=1 Tax=uncultured Enterovirga sp. TaxID=2026352 RepID=UPI0035CA47E4
MTWGPFVPGIDAAERKARLRSLRALVKVLTGPRGHDANLALLRAEITDGDSDVLREAHAEFGRLGTLDQRRVLSSFADVQTPILKVVHG